MNESDVTAFLGRWESVSGRLGADDIPLPRTVLTLRSESYRIATAQGREEGRAVWRASALVQAVDLVGTGGAHAGQTLAAIIRVRGRVLQLCYAIDGSRRPTTFDVPPGTAWVTVRYRRLDEGDESGSGAD